MVTAVVLFVVVAYINSTNAPQHWLHVDDIPKKFGNQSGVERILLEVEPGGGFWGFADEVDGFDGILIVDAVQLPLEERVQHPRPPAAPTCEILELF